MTKERPHRTRKKIRNIAIAVFAVFIVFVAAMMFIPNKIVISENDTFLEVAGNIPIHGQSFSAFSPVLNPSFGQSYTFVDVKASDASSFTKKLEASGIFYKPKGVQVITGNRCEVGDLVRFVICDNQNSKASCTTDMFTEMWQIQSTSDYLNTKDFYVHDLELYYTYSCYKADEIYADDFERSFLYEGKCQSRADTNGRGKDYGTEKFCLEALAEIEEAQIQEEEEDRQQQIEVQLREQEEQKREQNEQSGNTCSGGSVYAKDSASGYCQKFSQKCDVPTGWNIVSSCSSTTTSGTTTTTTTTNEEGSQVSVSGNTITITDSSICEIHVAERDTELDNLCSDYGFVQDSTSHGCKLNNELRVTCKQESTNNEDSIALTCDAYEKITADNKCKFSITSLFTGDGFKEYYRDEPLAVVIGILVLAILGIVGLVALKRD